MDNDFNIRKFLLETFYDRKDVMFLSEKGMAFAVAMIDFENTLSKTQKAKLEEALNLQSIAHNEEMEKLVDWCVEILKK